MKTKKFYYCSKCLTTNLRPNSNFIDGICSACLYSNNPFDSKKLKNLLEIKINSINKNNKNNKYDCLIGVSGGKDSLRQSLWVRDKLNLNPLLLCCAYPPIQTSYLGARNLENLIKNNFDLYITNPAPNTAKNLSLKSFIKFGNVCSASELALISSIPKIAIEKKINICFFGENPALQEGDFKTLGKDPLDGNNLRNLNTLSISQEYLLNTIESSQPKYLYQYPSKIDFKKNKIDIFYLGPIIEDWSNLNNSFYSVLNGLQIRNNKEHLTGDITNATMLDEEFTNINMMIKYLKFGFGRASDHINEMIRSGKISREKGIKIVKKYDGVCSIKTINKYCEWVGISKYQFFSNLKKFVNKDLFKIEKNKFIARFDVGYPLWK